MPWRSVATAMMGVLVGVGLARFSYAPLLPVLISHGWFAPGAAAYLGAANLLGYLAGALASRRLAVRFGTPKMVRLAMLLAAISLLACSIPLPFLWFFVWRLLSGIVGGLLMILGPASVMAHVPANRRGLASGLMITGVGLGIAASGTLVPTMLHWSLSAAWLGLGTLSLVLTALAWNGWPSAPPPIIAPPISSPTRFGPISLSYGLSAVGMVPHMVFLSDYVARGLGRGIDAGAFSWVIYGVGALGGAVVAGRIADRIGPPATMRGIILVQAATVVALLASVSPLVVGLSALVSGALGPAISAVMLGRVGQLAGSDGIARARGWTQATIAWAAGQAAGAYAMAWLFGALHGYAALFLAAMIALAAAIAVELVLSLRLQSRIAA
ncbi:YbfB/YjiJ family MFS transporter [Acidisphaera sp. L21]|uniref:YbfB/YjiJ family MFS transporter n=1 Tax=Acidisphaera sp. L21 TaxID=1641851 RepID=UPI00131B539C|nr:YbfB/YjiJ family MFS transporter [Acidisphaera sp. L21]